jgi:serine/threonine-protein kinase RsbW
MPSTVWESPTPGKDPRVVLNIASSVEELKLVDDACERFARMVGLDGESAHELGTAVREAAANAIKHGNAGDRSKRVHIEFDIPNENGRSCVRVRVRDEGAGFDPSRVPDPLAPPNVSSTSGRGVFLMRTFMDEVAVLQPPSGGTEIVMRKTFRRSPGSLLEVVDPDMPTN